MSRTILAVALLAAFGCGAGDGGQPEQSDVDDEPPVELRLESRPEIVDRPPLPRSLGDEGTVKPLDPDGEEKTVPVRLGRLFRRSDDRPTHDDERLRRLGIRKYESERLRLYTDLEPEVAERLPPLVDLAYEQWVEYFGELPPTREATPFQVTGYLMKDERRFREAGLVPRDLPRFLNGRHRGYEFWMYDQTEDYYRRHLVLHEATHCFTTCVGSRLPVWYLEGVAELFATHSLVRNDEGEWTLQTRVMPDDKKDFGGLGRITLVEEAVAAGRAKTLRDVAGMPVDDYLKPEAYAWAWAATRFFDGHPVYGERLRKAGQRAVTAGESFDDAFDELLGEDAEDWRFEWQLFARDLRHGYDEQRAAAALEPPSRIDANRGWQSSGSRVQRGQAYTLKAEGRFTLADEPVPWTSEANGVSIRYVGGRPIGQLLGCIRTVDGVSDVFPLGTETTFVAPADGTLFVRLNDSLAELADNRDGVAVAIVPTE